MGIITLALVAHGNLPAKGFQVPFWVVVSSAAVIALGTYSGGWRIIKTLGSRIIKMDSAQGFSAQGSGAAVILAASGLGFPLSTTQVISGGVVGAGAAKRLSAVRWGVAGNIVIAWVLTIPAAAIVAAALYLLMELFGISTTGPIVVAVCTLAGLATLGMRHLRRTPPRVREQTT
jgi:PiT family inorganic phosphate transporter